MRRWPTTSPTPAKAVEQGSRWIEAFARSRSARELLGVSDPSERRGRQDRQPHRHARRHLLERPAHRARLHRRPPRRSAPGGDGRARRDERHGQLVAPRQPRRRRRSAGSFRDAQPPAAGRASDGVDSGAARLGPDRGRLTRGRGAALHRPRHTAGAGQSDHRRHFHGHAHGQRDARHGAGRRRRPRTFTGTLAGGAPQHRALCQVRAATRTCSTPTPPPCPTSPAPGALKWTWATASSARRSSSSSRARRSPARCRASSARRPSAAAPSAPKASASRPRSTSARSWT